MVVTLEELFGIKGKRIVITGGGGILCGEMSRALGALGARDREGFEDGKFKNASGPVRLSGAVNLTDFPGKATFDCVFILDVGPGAN